VEADDPRGAPEVVVADIMGYRTWQVWMPGDPLDAGRRWAPKPRLLSFSGTEWPTDAWLEATCSRDTHRWTSECAPEDVPGEDCSGPCGVHAARSREHLVSLSSWLGKYTDQEIVDNCGHGAQTIAIGETALAGKVIPCEKGWRAKKARIVRLWVPHAWWRVVRPLQEAYRVPVGLTNTFDRGSGNGLRA
jgi:hypothetical protein